MARATRRSGTGAGPSQRQLRVGELIRQSLSELLSRGDIHDEILEATTVTVPEVRVSPDLRNATVFVMPLGGRDAASVIAALRRHDRFIRGAVARSINLKYAPDLSFRLDETFDEADRISQLLASPHVRRDTEGE